MRIDAMLALPFALSLALSTAGCHGAGPYGHATRYAPLGDEAAQTASAREYDPVMVQRQPEEWHGKPVSLFAVVTTRGTGPGGSAYLALSVRRIEPRNACDDAQDEDTCRTTVSDADFGVVHALVPLRGEDDTGAHSVGGGSLVRRAGNFGETVDSIVGGPVMRPTWYRHWPRGSYVTKSATQTMRQ